MTIVGVVVFGRRKAISGTRVKYALIVGIEMGMTGHEIGIP